MFIALAHDPKRPKLEQRIGDVIDGAGVDEEEAASEADYWNASGTPLRWDLFPATRDLVERVQDEGGAVEWKVLNGRLADVAR